MVDKGAKRWLFGICVYACVRQCCSGLLTTFQSSVNGFSSSSQVTASCDRGALQLATFGLNSDVIRRLVLANWTILFVLARLFSITNFDTAMSLYEMTPNHSASLQLLLHWHCGLWPDALRNAC